MGSALAAVAHQLELASRAVGQDQDEAGRLIQQARGETVAMIGRVRQLVVGQGEAVGWPTDADEQIDVVTRLRAALTDLRSAFQSTVELTLDLNEELMNVKETVAVQIFWIAHEAVVNVLRHASATRCSVSVSVDEREIHLRVRDDGVGFPHGMVPEGTGLTSMRERAEDHGGWFEIRTVPPSGALVEAGMPI